jgi:iron complex transport system substrate-binding protein
MVRFVKNISLSILLFFFLLSCGVAKEKFPPVDGNVLPISYSSLLEIVECDGYTVVDIADPWGSETLQRYILVPSASELPANLPQGVLLRTPLESVLLFSGVHAGLLCELGVENAIKGVCDAQYMYNDAVAYGLANGTVVNCGSSLNVDSESLLQVSPDAVFVLPYENGGFGKLENLGYPLVLCADYMETSPLGCAEWMRFYGRLLGKPTTCDSLFNVVRVQYEALRDSVKLIGENPGLMCELKSSSAWYVPCGESTMGRMYADAGADYIFASNNTGGSIPLSYEVMLDKASDADVWLVKYNSPSDMTRASLVADFKGYSYFKPFTEGNIYACNTARKRVFEETAFHPERLLRELLFIFHPGLLPGYELVYYEKMPE